MLRCCTDFARSYIIVSSNELCSRDKTHGKQNKTKRCTCCPYHSTSSQQKQSHRSTSQEHRLPRQPRHHSTTCQRIGSCHHSCTCCRHHSNASQYTTCCREMCVPFSRSEHMSRRRKLAISVCFPEIESTRVAAYDSVQSLTVHQTRLVPASLDIVRIQPRMHTF
jgi:hypothetical protein